MGFRRRQRSLRAALGAALLFLACTSGGQAAEFDREAVQAFEVGRTTRGEVESALGEPFSKRLDRNGRERWLYVYPRLRGNGAGPAAGPRGRAETLTLEFDGDALSDIECGTSTELVPQT